MATIQLRNAVYLNPTQPLTCLFSINMTTGEQTMYHIHKIKTTVSNYFSLNKPVEQVQSKL